MGTCKSHHPHSCRRKGSSAAPQIPSADLSPLSRFRCRRTSSPRPPQPTGHQHNLPTDHPGSCGGARSRGLLTQSPFPGELRNRDFAAGGRRASHGSQRLKRTRPRAPVAARKRWSLERTVRQRRRGQRRRIRPSQIFWGGAAAGGGGGRP